MGKRHQEAQNEGNKMSYEVIITGNNKTKVIKLKSKTLTEALDEAMFFQTKNNMVAVRKEGFDDN